MKKIPYILTILLIAGIAIYAIKQNNIQNTDLSPTTNNEDIIPVSATTTKIKIALLREPGSDEDMKNLKGCDVVVMQEREVLSTTTPLKTAMQELFNPNKNYLVQMEFAARDFISTQKDLVFKDIVVEEGVAKVYLVGKVGPLSGVCDDPRIKTQIEETIFQFPLINSVEIYLNGIKNDFKFSQKGDIEMMNITVYIQDKDIARVRDCSAVGAISYQVPKTTAVADTSLKILFSDELSMYGKYKSVTIANGVAKVMLESDMTPAGYPIGSLSSCQSGHLMSVLTKTLTQYNTIKSVQLYSPKGEIMF